MLYGKNNLNFFPVFILLAECFFSCGALATQQTDIMHVTVEGQILYTPCSIDTGSRDQILYINATPASVISRSGLGRPLPFTIRLKDCVLERFENRLSNWKGFSITFDGGTDESDFAISGSAGGVALRIFDANGNRAVPGKPLPDEQIVKGDNELKFTLQLVSDKRKRKKGNYCAVIHFSISYF